ncbi:hypothetical protein OO006_00145 [Prosthecochloris sp. SCSIO W1101]|uniref:hypothetical protein n=1 Tax=Prosthecochloris sp. SCSIO W1101 TaxID=2992242 RepID=UPI00223DCBA6|nr:hypothetical protein [Prosthecochloris sp. SCSIO W1101]UZJ41464.1 hypothetical protein OO006_00145 [Prosthecochloris sp. SCSIO W1101]
MNWRWKSVFIVIYIDMDNRFDGYGMDAVAHPDIVSKPIGENWAKMIMEAAAY